MKKYIITILFLVHTGASFSQSVFQRYYPHLATFYHAQQTSDGGFILSGNYPSNLYTAFLLKLAPNGDVTWGKSLIGNNSYSPSLYFVKQTSDGGYIAAGHNHVGSSTFLFYLVRTNANGDTLWTRCYGGDNSSYNNASSVIETADGGFIVAGEANNSHLGLAGHLIKINSNGDVQWSKAFQSTVYYDVTAFSDIEPTKDSGYIVTGTFTNYSLDKGVFIARLNSSGDTLWTRSFVNLANNYNLTGRSAVQTSDGGFIVLGSTTNTSTLSGFAPIIKLNSAGDTVWTRAFAFSIPGSNVFNNLNTIRQTPDGGYIIAGNAKMGTSTNYGNYAMLIKTDSLGDTLWTRKYSNSDPNNMIALNIYSMTPSSDGSYMLAGNTNDYTGGAFIIKTDANGNSFCDAGHASFNIVNIPPVVRKGAVLDSGYAVSHQSFIVGGVDTTYIINPCLYPPPICMVTVDSALQKNKVIWAKNYDSLQVAYCKIYKENPTYGFMPVASVSIDSMSEYTDNASHPELASNCYKTLSIDKHGFESYSKSSPHCTIHLSIDSIASNQVYLLWNAYSGFPVSSYKIFRGNASGLFLIDSTLSDTTYIDNNPQPTDTLYMVEVSHFPCNSTAKSYNATMSNITRLATGAGITEVNNSNLLSLFPNPANDKLILTLTCQSTYNNTLTIYSTIGAPMLCQPLLKTNTVIDIADFASGVYIITVQTDKGIMKKKLIKE
jgi:hypothetical protein